jgi:hypothetical protein
MAGNSESVDVELGSSCFILEVCKIFPGRRIERMEWQMQKDAVI